MGMCRFTACIVAFLGESVSVGDLLPTYLNVFMTVLLYTFFFLLRTFIETDHLKAFIIPMNVIQIFINTNSKLKQTSHKVKSIYTGVINSLWFIANSCSVLGLGVKAWVKQMQSAECLVQHPALTWVPFRHPHMCLLYSGWKHRRTEQKTVIFLLRLLRLTFKSSYVKYAATAHL